VLDLPTIKAWTLLIRLTIAEYLGLDPALASAEEDGKRDDTARRRTELVSLPVAFVPPLERCTDLGAVHSSGDSRIQ